MIWPFRHFGLKLLSLGLALSLWMVVSGEETVERGLRVPLELQQFPAGLELQGDAPRVRLTSACADPLARWPACRRATSSPSSTSEAHTRAIACFI